MRHGFFGILPPVLVAMLVVAGPSWAHHGDAGRYNETVSTVVGVVAQWRLINPHSVLILDVEDENGNVVRWRGELGNPTSLGTRHGWDPDTFKPGDRITMTGRALKNGSPTMTLSEGSILVDTDTGEELYRER
jgi:hypothetical protein